MARQPDRDASPDGPAERLSRRASIRSFQQTSIPDLFWDLITMDRLLTRPIVHLIYWAGLIILLLGGFSVIGGAVGVAWREEGPMHWVLAIPLVVIGFVLLAAGALIWRSICEFYVAVFRISDDLRAMRAELQAQTQALVQSSTPLSAPRARKTASTVEGPDGGL